MPHITPKAVSSYPWFVRLILKRQRRKYGRILAPALLWGRLPGPFTTMLLSLGAFQSRRFPIDTALRSLVSIRVAQLNGCSFCVDLNAHNHLKAAGEKTKAIEVASWRESEVYDDHERAALLYAEEVPSHCDSIGREAITRLRAFFSEDEVTALTAWISFQNMSAKFNAALGAEEHGFCRVPGQGASGAPSWIGGIGAVGPDPSETGSERR